MSRTPSFNLSRLNPVYGPGDNISFTAKLKYGELKKTGGLRIEVKDWDRIGNNDLIGHATIEPSQLLDFSKSGKTSSIQLEVPPDRKETDAGIIDLKIDDPEFTEVSFTEVSERESEDTKPKAASSPSEDPPEISDCDDPEMNETLHLNFKVVSCRNLLKGDYSSSDPYVKFMLGKKELHRTKNLLKT